MDDDRLLAAVLTGSCAEGRPVRGCRCPSCRLGTDDTGPRNWTRPSGLLLPGLLAIDGEPPADAPLPADAPAPPARLITTEPDGAAPVGTAFLHAGERAEYGDVRVAALPAGTAEGEPDRHRVVLVLGHGSRALLWAAGSGPLPAVTLDALHGAGLAAAALDARTPAAGERDSDAHGSGLGAAHQVARLRAVGALADDARLVAVGLPHTGPTPERFARLAEAWGVAVLPDGSPVFAARPASPSSARPLDRPWRTVVLGAAGSGKSLTAESLLAALPEVVYTATGPQPDDADEAWTARVTEHRRRRPPWWRTVEGGELADLLTRPGPPLLVDSLGTWLTAQLTEVGCWEDRPGWPARLEERVAALVLAWRQAARPVVAVAEEVGWGVVPATPSGGRFRDSLGRLNRRLCDQSERVLLVVAGRTVELDPDHPVVVDAPDAAQEGRK